MNDHKPLRSHTVRQVGLVDLFAMVMFFTPMFATVAGVERLGGGSIRYLVALPLGIGLGTILVFFEWKIAKAIWLHFAKYSAKIKNALGISLFVIQLFWIFVGLVSGDKLSAFIVSRLAR